MARSLRKQRAQYASACMHNSRGRNPLEPPLGRQPQRRLWVVRPYRHGDSRPGKHHRYVHPSRAVVVLQRLSGPMARIRADKHGNVLHSKCLGFVPRFQKKSKKNSEVEAIPLWPQYTASWRTAQFQEQKWLVVSSQTRWLQLLVTASVRMSIRDVVARLCELAKTGSTRS